MGVAGTSSEAKGIDTIFLGELNVHLGGAYEKHKEDLMTALAGHGLEYVTRNFTPRQRYRGRGQWTCQIHI